jgi:predicted DNA-binding protein with PD1-like motif
MNIHFLSRSLLSVFLFICLAIFAHAQAYVSPTRPATTGRSPSVKLKLLDSTSQIQHYVLIFSSGDEVVSGLTEFAQTYHVKSAQYTAIGDATTAKVGWYDYSRKMFKVIPIQKPCEVTSLIGDIALFNNKPVAHSHINLADEEGISHGGHLLELFTGPTMEVFVTVYQTLLYKKLSPEFGAGVIDPNLEK